MERNRKPHRSMEKNAKNFLEFSGLTRYELHVLSTERYAELWRRYIAWKLAE